MLGLGPISSGPISSSHGNVKDETGHVHGTYLVVGRAGSQGRCACWLVRCVHCGRESVGRGSALRSCAKRSCRCQTPCVDEAGKVYGGWSVCRRAPAPPGWRRLGAWWWCRCDCGVVSRVQGSTLRAGASTSCGHRTRGGSRLTVYPPTGGYIDAQRLRQLVEESQACGRVSDDLGRMFLAIADGWAAAARLSGANRDEVVASAAALMVASLMRVRTDINPFNYLTQVVQDAARRERRNSLRHMPTLEMAGIL